MTRLLFPILFLIVSSNIYCQDVDNELLLIINDANGQLIDKSSCGAVSSFSYDEKSSVYEIVYSIGTERAYLHFQKIGNNGNLTLLGDQRNSIFRRVIAEGVIDFISDPKDNLVFIYRIEKNSL